METTINKTKFTPGPWKTMQNRILPFNYPEGQPIVKICWDGDIVTEKEAEANARLIAAAPEMYELLDLLQNVPPIYEDSVLKDKIQSILNKINP